MSSRHESVQENTSTPKRRRLGTGRILRVNKPNKENSFLLSNHSPIYRRVTATVRPEVCESPPLPSNQIKYLHDSRNSSSSDIPSSPGVFEKNDEHWESLSSTNLDDLCKSEASAHKNVSEIEDISDDMFQSRLEQESSQVKPESQLNLPIGINQTDFDTQLKESSFISGSKLLDLSLETKSEENQDMNELLTSKYEKHFRDNLEESFEMVNQSICGIQEETKKSDRSSLFETRDSFLLDIRESGMITNEKNSNHEFVKPKTPMKDINSDNGFYGLPIVTKSLFKTYRNIEKFYDWQEECLNLDAIKERRNLIYALPTSGGKTLVAEVLMLREVLNRKKNALFILPFVAIVQEKIWALSPFAIKLDFLVEEYAAGKGHLPPKKRRKKNSIYIATIEKGLALLRSLIELNRLDELGLIVVDELHLIGEPGRGGTLEILLTTAMFASKDIQIVGMSATIGNLPEIAEFLSARVFERHFRPVALAEFVKLGDSLHKLVANDDGVDAVLERQLAYDYSSAATTMDPDLLGGLVSEVVPGASCLVFCPTKRNCENVAALLCKLQRREMTLHRTADRVSLASALRAEGASSDLVKSVRYGIAFHHAGLAGDERSLLEQAFRNGVISVLCCTSTLAAGVNLPAKRVIVRAPLVGREFITLAAYRQMVGRAGRAGVCEEGESIIICGAREWPLLRGVLRGGLLAAASQLAPAAPALALSAAALKLAHTRVGLRELLARTLLARSSEVDVKQLCDDSIRSLIQSGALQVASGERDPDDTTCYVRDDDELVVSKLGRAAIKGCMDLSTAKQLLEDLKVASQGLVLMGSLHLIYLVTPHDAASIRPDYRHYYTLYGTLDEEGLQTAKILGITEMNAIRMMTGKPITNVPERVLCRFYLALMLHDLWKQVPFPAVADKYCLPRGTVQSVMASASSFASCAHKVCEELDLRWFTPLMQELASRLQHCAAPELHQLMELPAVKKARALQLMRGGYKRIEDVAKASVDDLVGTVDHLSRTAATHLISAARMMLIEKVENLRAEAEDVMEELNL
ncbi:helicase POLQ-like [Ostrinia nubilalis]|uniref:helicase POLQ-like n=1 Tax=Ostrinia nubilalis TaxID=29057 RepID=UPI0030823514